VFFSFFLPLFYFFQKILKNFTKTPLQNTRYMVSYFLPTQDIVSKSKIPKILKNAENQCKSAFFSPSWGNFDTMFFGK